MEFLGKYLFWTVSIGLLFALIKVVTNFKAERKITFWQSFLRILPFFIAGALVGAGIALLIVSQPVLSSDAISPDERLSFTFGVSSIVLAIFAIALTIGYQSQSTDELLDNINQVRNSTNSHRSKNVSDIENGVTSLTRYAHVQTEDPQINVETRTNLQDVSQNLQKITRRLEEQNTLLSQILSEMKDSNNDLRCNLHLNDINHKISSLEQKVMQTESKIDCINKSSIPHVKRRRS